MSNARQTHTPVRAGQVTLQDTFWKPRIETNRRVTLPHEYKLCKQTGRIDAMKLKAARTKPHQFWDSDVAKWIEAAGYSLATHADKALERRVDAYVDLMTKAQMRDGYLNSYYQTLGTQKRWTNLRDMHELYCAGHLMEAAVAYYEATGKRKMLEVMCRCADHIGRTFGRGPGQKRGYPGHEEIELALVKLYHATGEKRYLKLAKYFVDERGRQPHYYDVEAKARGDDPQRYHHQTYDYCQAHLPVRKQTTAEGHAVRALYLYAGMVDVAAATNDKGLLTACKRLWRNIVKKRMYVIGGVGSTRIGERFTFDYDLPNDTAYAETCANIALVFFAHRMLQVERDGEYANVMERAFYNGVLSGVSLDGKQFFYDNLLAVDPELHRFSGQKSPWRQEWFGCACCPPNIARLLASFGQYIYTTSGKELAAHLYVASQAQVEVAGESVSVQQSTAYPWKDKVRLTLKPKAPVAFTLALRLPGWCRKPGIKVNGRTVGVVRITRKGYAYIQRTWRRGDRVELTLPMPVERIEAHPSVRHDCGRVALQRGPVIYCLEQEDNGADLADVVLPRTARLAVRSSKLFGGIPVIVAKALRRERASWVGTLYRPAGSKTKRVTLKAVPYCLWNNRADGEMLVWIREA